MTGRCRSWPTSCASRSIRRISPPAGPAKPILEQLGITYTQWIVIVALWDDDHQTVKSLGEKLFLESNTLTPILKRLEELGYLRRRRDPADERQVIVGLTEAGRRLREQGGQRDLVDATGLDSAEFTALQQAIVKLRNSLLKHAQGPEEPRRKTGTR